MATEQSKSKKMDTTSTVNAANNEKAMTNAVPLSSLTSQQLSGLKENLDVEIQALTNHVVDLRYATRRLETSRKALSGLGVENEGREALVPFTQSVYVAAKLKDTERVLIDIGTGYHVQRSIPEAERHFDGRIQMIGDTCSKALKAITEKKRFAELIAQQQKQK